MGMKTYFVYSTDNSVTIDQSKLTKPTWEWFAHNTSVETLIENKNYVSDTNSDDNDKDDDIYDRELRKNSHHYFNPTSTMLLSDFMKDCDGKIYSYMHGQLRRAWCNVAEAISKPVSLYFIYEEGFPFRIVLNQLNATFDVCEDDKWMKKMKLTESKKKRKKLAPEQYVDIEDMGKIIIEKYINLVDKIPWKEVVISAQMESCIVG